MISLIIVANFRFNNYIDGYLESVYKHEPETDVVVIDTTLEGDNYNYTKALNKGAKKAKGDWLIFSNDDVLCSDKFKETIESFDVNKIYGKEIRKKGIEWGAEVSYIYGFILIMHRSLYEKVGKFDEYYIHAGFDDIDYCWRALNSGFQLQAEPRLPFIHLADLPNEKHRRCSVPGYQENMKRSKKHFIKKVKITREKLYG